MKLRFAKMEGLGNDFVILDARTRSIQLSPEQIERLANRRYGVGCDQVLQLEPAPDNRHAARYRVFNRDGTEAEQCGNGVRCLALYLNGHVASQAAGLNLAGPAGDVPVEIRGPDAIAVNMGAPRFEPGVIPFLADTPAKQYRLDVDGAPVTIGAVSMGNPHAVIQVDDVRGAPVRTLGVAIQNHPRFPQGANVGFMEVVSRDHIRLRVYERGAGETRACGSGACAAVAVGRQNGWLDEQVTVDLPGGSLVIKWTCGGEPVWMTGPAARVFDGEIEI